MITKKIKTKYNNNFGITDKLQIRNIGIPKDYHCNSDFRYCQKYIGEIYDNDNDTYYSNRGRNRYYDTKLPKHIAPGQIIGYRWAIQNFTTPGEWVFDPTVGTGSAIVESINNGRNGAGIELEYPAIARGNIEFQDKRSYDKPTGTWFLAHENAKNLTKILSGWSFKKESLSLVINGTPYPSLGSISSDAPERKSLGKNGDNKIIINKNNTFNYKIEDNFGKKKGKEYWKFINKMYLDCIPFMKKGGKLVILIKDMMKNKKPYLLHAMIADNLLALTDELIYDGVFIHKHCPTTLFQNTYSKKFPDADQIPLYQTGIVFKKI